MEGGGDDESDCRLVSEVMQDAKVFKSALASNTSQEHDAATNQHFESQHRIVTPILEQILALDRLSRPNASTLHFADSKSTSQRLPQMLSLESFVEQRWTCPELDFLPYNLLQAPLDSFENRLFFKKSVGSSDLKEYYEDLKTSFLLDNVNDASNSNLALDNDYYRCALKKRIRQLDDASIKKRKFSTQHPTLQPHSMHAAERGETVSVPTMVMSDFLKDFEMPPLPAFYATTTKDAHTTAACIKYCFASAPKVEKTLLTKIPLPPNLTLSSDDGVLKFKEYFRHVLLSQIPAASKKHFKNHRFRRRICSFIAHSVLDHARKFIGSAVQAIYCTKYRARLFNDSVAEHIKKNHKEWDRKIHAELEDQKRMLQDESEKARQQKKLDFLLTQTELYSHFMSQKLLPDNSASLVHSSTENYCESKQTIECAKKEAFRAFQAHKSRIQNFDQREEFATGDGRIIESTKTMTLAEQPKNFKGTLKSYQVKGLNWLISLHDQGINGILADEMGLGKTIQIIAFLAHLAEERNIWGPFIIVAPSSTLSNWYGEFEKFYPRLNVLPYWGNLKQRSTLRKVLNSRYLYREDSVMHVVITSYQLIVQDEKYFHRIHWEYMILDEAHAIKSSTSLRWNTLLSFGNVRSRLLLTGTPIQNNMTELWALLHFIMPTLFDSQNEFYKWFSKDIEDHAQGAKITLNEDQLNRLHSILKPFMLRRVKSEVENELPLKYEKEIKFDMTSRQRKLYNGIKNKLSFYELFDKTNTRSMVKANQEKNTRHLLNIVMQFRNVCNHPEIIQKSEIFSPYCFASSSTAVSSCDTLLTPSMNNPIEFKLPKLIYREALLNLSSTFSGSNTVSLREKWLYNTFNIFSQSYIQECLFGDFSDTSNASRSCCWDFSRFFRLSPAAIEHARQSHLWLAWQAWLANLDDQTRWRNIHGALDAPQNSLHTPLPTDWVSVKSSVILLSFIKLFPYRFEESADLIKLLAQLYVPTVMAPPIRTYFTDSRFLIQSSALENHPCASNMLYGRKGSATFYENFTPSPVKLLEPRQAMIYPYVNVLGCPGIVVPKFSSLIEDCAKLRVFDAILAQLKNKNHRVLVYSQFTEVLDLLEDFLCVRKYRFLRLDGSSKLEDRRDMVEQFQCDPGIFIFLLSTRAGGLGINLTSADVVVFYDSDWNPTADAQAMDRAHRTGQTKPVIVYRLITRDSIEEHMLTRAKQKGTIQNLVIKGSSFERSDEDLKILDMMDIIMTETLDDGRAKCASQSTSREFE